MNHIHTWEMVAYTSQSDVTVQVVKPCYVYNESILHIYIYKVSCSDPPICHMGCLGIVGKKLTSGIVRVLFGLGWNNTGNSLQALRCVRQDLLLPVYRQIRIVYRIV